MKEESIQTILIKLNNVIQSSKTLSQLSVAEKYSIQALKKIHNMLSRSFSGHRKFLCIIKDVERDIQEKRRELC
jgi:hypothetical protein